MAKWDLSKLPEGRKPLPDELVPALLERAVNAEAERDALKLRAEQAEVREAALLANNEEARQFLRQRDALKAEVERLKAQAVTVKQLEWGVGDEPGEWSAGPYDVWREFDRFKLYYWRIVIGDQHETVEAAKAAAQDHHNARILSAITARSEAEVWNEAMDKACATIVKEARETFNGVDEYSAGVCADTIRTLKRQPKGESHE